MPILSMRTLPEEIWTFLERDMPKTLPHFLVLTVQFLRFTAGEYSLIPIGLDSPSLIQDMDSATSAVTSETERLNYVYLSSIFGKGRLKGWFISAKYSREYVSTTTGTYYYRTYVRPMYLDSSLYYYNLDTEQTLISRSKSQGGTAEWANVAANACVFRSGLDLPFDGLLGLRVRTTSWSTAGDNGCGLAYLNDPYQWKVCFNYVLD